MKSFFSKTRLFVGIVLSLTICMMFVGCSNSTSAPASEARGFTDFEHIEKEYLATIEKLNWPDGVTLPDKLEGEDTGTSFQVGYGDTRASNLWEYSWMKEWLNSYSTDSARAEKALEELEKAFDMPYMGTDRCDDATRNYLRENIDKAKLGDPSGFRECMNSFTQSNCNIYREVIWKNETKIQKKKNSDSWSSSFSCTNDI